MSARTPFAFLSSALPRAAAWLAALCAGACVAAPLAPQRLRLPPGFQAELLTAAVPDARGLALGRQAPGRTVVFVGSASEGRVYAVEVPASGPARVRTVASGLQLPISVAYREGALYVSAVSRIVRLDGIDARLDAPPAPVVVTDALPGERHHGAKYIAFGPDGRLYVSVGAPCNVCEPDQAHGLILRMNADGSGSEVVARGVRNSVGFDWSPQGGALWFTDNGRDMLGDDLPGDELNRLGPGAAAHFGFPYCHQGNLTDPEFGGSRRCAEFTPPAAVLGAHVAALGMRFYGGRQFPAEYRGNVFIAEHGSWNRTQRSGYRVVRVAIDAQGRAGPEQPFIEGWLGEGGAVSGRPADLLVLPDGSLLVSDQLGGALYRVRYVR